MFRLLIWALVHEPKMLHMYLAMLRGAAMTQRQERLRNMLAQFTQQELRYIAEQS